MCATFAMPFGCEEAGEAARRLTAAVGRGKFRFSPGRRVPVFAGIAQLVEHDLAKVGVAGSSPVSRSRSDFLRAGRRAASCALAGALLAQLAAMPPAAAQGRRTLGERSRSRPALAPGDPAPALLGADSSGVTVSLDWRTHSLTLISFWTPTCVPCRRVMAAFQSLYDERSAEGLAVYGLVAGRDLAPMDEAREQLGIRYPLLSVGRDVLVRWGAGTIVPVTYLVSREGRIVRRYPGVSDAQLEALAADVGAALAGRPLGPLLDSAEPPTVETP